VFYLRFKQFVVFVTFCFLCSCQQKEGTLSKIEGHQISIDSTIASQDSITAFVKPFRARINEVLDSTLAHAPKSLLLEEGSRNTSMGNLMADIILMETEPLFKSKTGKDLDFAVLNRGGIRSVISAGNVTARNAYEIMPFENYISVVELSGTAVRKLINFLITASRPHPIAGMQIVLDKNGKPESVNIRGKPFDESRSYYVATSDYLVQGGPGTGFFNEIISTTRTGYLVRNAIIDHFKKIDTVRATIDNRFIQR